MKTSEISETCGKSEEVNKNPFNLLPKEIIIYIFDKISEAKSLCICSLVSKKISSLVLETNIVSFEIPSWARATSFRLELPPAAAAAAVAAALEEETPLELSSLGPSISSMIKFLMKFSCIKSITIYLNFSENPTSEPPLVKWNFDESGVIFVSAKIVDDDVHDSSYDFDVANNSNYSITFENDNILGMVHLVEHYFIDYLCRLNFTVLILEKFPNLKNILVLDATKEGRILLKEDGIVDMKVNINIPLCENNMRLKIWQAPLLHLPLSGRVMKEVTVGVLVDIGFDEVLKMCENGFEDDEYRELAMTMVKKTPCFEDFASSILADLKDLFSDE